MSHRFDPDDLPIRTPVVLVGPRRAAALRLTVDTVAMRTVVRADVLLGLGFDLDAAPAVRIRSATGRGVGRRVTTARFEALDVLRTDFPVVAHEFPLATAGDGLLGLDFVRGHRLTVDFADGWIALRRPRAWWRLRG